MSWRKYLQKLSHRQLKELAGLCAGVALLLLAAVFISQGGLRHGVFLQIAPTSQTASILSCFINNNCGGSVAGFTNIAASPNPVAQGSIVTVYWQQNTGDVAKIWDSDGNAWLNPGYIGTAPNPAAPQYIYYYGNFQVTITHTVTYYICGWSYPFGNTSKPGSCSSGFPGSQVTVTVTAPPPTVSITGNGQSNPNSITVIPGQTVHLVATSDPSGSYIVH